MSTRPTYVTGETTLAELEAILTAHRIPQVGLNMNTAAGRWAAVIRRENDEISASHGHSLVDVLDGVIGMDAMIAEMW